MSTHRKEEVTDIMGDVHRQSHVGEVEAVAETDEGQGNQVMADKLFVVLAGLFHAQHEHNKLLRPVGGLEKVVEFEVGLVELVREALVHAGGVEVPDRRVAHDINAPGPDKGKVDGRVHLLHEACLLALGLESCIARKRAEQLLHDELAGERQHDDVEGHETNIPEALCIENRCVCSSAGGRGQLITEEDEIVDRVGLGRVEGEEAQKDGEQDGGQDPGMSHGIVGRPGSQTPCLASLGLALRGRCCAIFRVGALRKKRLLVEAIQYQDGVTVQWQRIAEHTLPLVPFRWAKDVASDGAVASLRDSA